MAGRIRWWYVRAFLFAAGAAAAILLGSGAAAAAPPGTTAPAVPPGPAASAPTAAQWVQAHRATTVWADPESARALAPAPQWTYFRVAGRQEKLRLPVFDPRTGVTGWIDALSVGPTGAPDGASLASTAAPPPAATPAAAPASRPPVGKTPITIRPVTPPPLRPAGPPSAVATEPPVERWLQTHEAGTLYADREGDTAVASLAQWTFLRWTGPQVGLRLPVREPSSGAVGWVDARTVGPSGPPPVAAPPPAAPPAAPPAPPVAAARVARPPGIGPGEHWIEVDLAKQRLRLIEGERVVHTAPVTTGKAGFATPTGTFRIFSRVANETMDSATTGIGRESGEGYLLKNVRYTQYFADGGYALHANYWQPDSVFGRVATSHGCVGMRLADAETVWSFASNGTAVQIH